MDADDAAMRAADERTQQEWRKTMAKKIKQTSYGPVKRPPTTTRADEGLDTLGELLGDVADAIREADRREQVIDSAGEVDRGRFPVLNKGGGQ
jgi:hypothetical protein